MAEQHRHELTPAPEPPGVPLGLVLFYNLLELCSRKQLEQLREDAAYSIQGGSLLLRFRFGSPELKSTVASLPPSD
jgi:hypothetical protein